ncbi:sigma-70 family RNA polymerase sigma factor [Niabella sp.]|uniref:RNA polymerase sigma factor n=1 Tax=Niabella sp. TaxID=1962976 RepID=UPI0026053D0D|nr:sigma-70 family RNA polymerase sigma factor [Niabella sp.]
MTDGELLDRIKSADAAAYRRLYDKYWPPLYTYLASKTGNTEEAKDILQELWLKIWLNPGFVLINSEGEAKGFLITYLSYRVLDYFRNLQGQRKKRHVVANIHAQAELHPGVLEQLNGKDLVKVINKVIETLPHTTGQIVQMRLGDQTVDETAAQLSVSKKTVRNKFSEGLKVLRKNLKLLHVIF